MKTGIIYRYDVSSVVFPRISEMIVSEQNLNLIDGQRLRQEFLNGESELAKEINKFVDNGDLIPIEYWVPFFTALWDSNKTNVFCGLITHIDQFMEFEKHFIDNDISIDFIKYFKINDLDSVVQLAVEKYAKVFKDNEEHLIKRIKQFEERIEPICEYVEGKYNLEVIDYMTSEIEI